MRQLLYVYWLILFTIERTKSDPNTTRPFSLCEASSQSSEAALCGSLLAPNAHEFKNITVTKGCSLSSQKLPLLESLTCPNVSGLPLFLVSRLPSLRYLVLSAPTVAKCELTALPWQAMAMANFALVVTASDCPLTCDCENAWMLSVASWPYFRFPMRVEYPSTLAKCDFTNCTRYTVSPTYTIVSTHLGASLTKSVFIDPVAPFLDRVPLPYAGWLKAGGFIEMPDAEQNATETSISVGLPALEGRHLGDVALFCWHCEAPAYAVFRVSL